MLENVKGQFRPRMTKGTNEMEQVQITSNSQAAQFGSQAISKWNSRDKQGAQGDALGFMALLAAHEQMTFIAIVKDKTVNERVEFDLQNYLDKPAVMKKDGTRDNKMTQARTLAVIEKVFGVKEPTNAQLQSVRRCCELVKNFLAKGYKAEDAKLSSRGYLEVPYALMHDEPKADAPEREHKTWQKNEDDTEVLDNTDGMSMASLGRRIAPKKAERAAQSNDNNDRGASFVASIDFVAGVLEVFNDVDGGDKEIQVPAPNEDVRKKLWALQLQLAKYFQEDPIEEEEKKEDKRTKNTRA